MPTRFEDVPLPYTSSHPVPTRLPARSTSLKRGKTLTRPERHVAPVPLITPASHADIPISPESNNGWLASRDWWVITTWLTTFWAPPTLLNVFGIRETQSRQAWREKITLCWIAILMGAIVGFATMGLQRVLCPSGQSDTAYQRLGTSDLTLSIEGWVFNISSSVTTSKVDFYALSSQMPGQDITSLFTRTSSDYPACTASAAYASTAYCNTTSSSNSTDCVLSTISSSTFSTLNIDNVTVYEGYSWDQVAALQNYLVIDGLVLNLSPYIDANPTAIDDDEVDSAIRQALSVQNVSGKDVTRQFYNRAVLKEAVPCLITRYLAGRIDKITPGCFVAALFLYASLTVILGVVLVRFAMACVFNWFLSAKLVQPPAHLARTVVSPSVLPEGANMSVHNTNGTAPWAAPSRTGKLRSKSNADMNGTQHLMSLSRIGAELFTVCLVTCYSEGEESIRSTLESISGTSYSDTRKLLWVVCDGMITGAGEKSSTPDICVAMLDADPRFGNPQPMGYIAVGSGAKRENRAMVYAGHYASQNGHRTPTIMVVKCGIPSEAKDKKPGNRGKRDSQLILMNFFSRVTYNDRMSPLDYDIFRKVQTLIGVTPDFFEVVLMVDADTKIYPDSLTHLVNCMANDNMIMGVCGETRIANKRQSWVTAIQVYEYFISHHHIKAFESVFGGVTCLPGCFSMYRIKARKDLDNDWVPILVKPEIVREYSQSEVVTLHQKNLLLLGEDRFLSTIMLRTFPHRRNIFLPQAKCRTIAPDTFSVLLSQRRRWINSTVHNLMELVRVRNLCGTFCFSMQFVVFMDLVGTVVLPIAICLTVALIVNSIITPPKTFEEAIPLMLLAAVLGLPAILILITTRKAIYVAWMIIYLFALPIWNFVLPVYSFWHFDDFSWGETRRVEGEIRSKVGHDDKTAVFDGTSIPLRRWDDWERSRLRKQRREEKRRKKLERSHGAQFYGDDGLGPPGRAWAKSEYDSDAGSIMSSDEDVWGAEIGGYNEHNPSFPPPPIALPPETVPMAGQTLGMDEMAAILDQGFDDRPPPAAFRPDRNGSSPLHRSHHPDHSYTGFGARQGQEQYAVVAPSPRSPHMPNSGDSVSSSIESRAGGSGHAKKRSGGGAAANRYGPLGPLDDDDRGWNPSQQSQRGWRG